MGIRNACKVMSADRAAGDRAEIGTSFWTALERPDVDEIVDDCLDVIYLLAELRGDPAPKPIRHR